MVVLGLRVVFVVVSMLAIEQTRADRFSGILSAGPDGLRATMAKGRGRLFLFLDRVFLVSTPSADPSSTVVPNTNGSLAGTLSGTGVS